MNTQDSFGEKFSKIHLIGYKKQKSAFSTDLNFAKQIKDINEQDKLDAIFLENYYGFPCSRNYTEKYNIAVNEINSVLVFDYYKSVLNYFDQFKDKKNLAVLVNKESLENLHDLFLEGNEKKTGFEIKKYLL